MNTPDTRDFSAITELPGSGATRDQLARLYSRYNLASQWAKGKRVLEVGCGAGLGLGYLANNAKLVIGGDYTESLIYTASSYYQGRVPLVQFDGQYLPFKDQSFDVVVLFEAIYYLPNAEKFLAEARRVLSQDGVLIISTVNKDWSEFSESLMSTRYYSVPDLAVLAAQQGFKESEFFGVFPTTATSLKQKAISFLRRFAASSGLMPKTLHGREKLKGLFYGGLRPLAPEVYENMAVLPTLNAIPVNQPDLAHKIIYMIARVS
jgi:ubiquinone/menaquinone biosynthesis C-methylase UbiE